MTALIPLALVLPVTYLLIRYERVLLNALGRIIGRDILRRY